MQSKGQHTEIMSKHFTKLQTKAIKLIVKHDLEKCSGILIISKQPETLFIKVSCLQFASSVLSQAFNCQVWQKAKNPQKMCVEQVFVESHLPRLSLPLKDKDVSSKDFKGASFGLYVK